MAKYNREKVGSLILDPTPASSSSSANHFRLWRASFRRKIFDAVSCGRSSHYRHDLQKDNTGGGGNGIGEKVITVGPASKGVAFEGKQREYGAEKKKDKEISEKLCDLLYFSEAEADVETKKKEETLEELNRVVKELQIEAVRDGGGGDEKLAAARKVRLLAKEDSGARVTLAMLGAIPPLVSLIDDSRIADANADVLIASLYALLNLGIGNDGNKAAIVEAGAVHKMLKLIESPNAPNPSIAEAVIANFLGLSALDSNKPIIGSSGAIPFLVKTLTNLNDSCSAQTREDALRALYNLSLHQPNVSFILETDVMVFLLNTLGDMEVSERILAILSNVVSIPEGRKAISAVPDAFPVLVDVLNWTDSSGCQEKATYILMLMAHKAYGDRQAMIEAGIESALLELTLLGTALAQKRASRILECLRMDKGKQVSKSPVGSRGAVSAPIYGTSTSSLTQGGASKDEIDDRMSVERKAVKQLVQQSLQNNMKRIVRRANLPHDFVPSEHLKSLTASSTSKSLPF